MDAAAGHGNFGFDRLGSTLIDRLITDITPFFCKQMTAVCGASIFQAVIIALFRCWNFGVANVQIPEERGALPSGLSIVLIRDMHCG